VSDHAGKTKGHGLRCTSTHTHTQTCIHNACHVSMHLYLTPCNPCHVSMHRMRPCTVSHVSMRFRGGGVSPVARFRTRSAGLP